MFVCTAAEKDVCGILLYVITTSIPLMNIIRHVNIEHEYINGLLHISVWHNDKKHMNREKGMGWSGELFMHSREGYFDV